MTENKPNWAEKANVALNTIQVAQNDQLQKTVSALGALHAEQARLQLNEQQAKQREDNLREHLWQMESALNRFLSDTSVTHCARNVLIKHVQELMTQLGVTSAAFREFADKDRLGAFLNRVEQTIQDSRNNMSAQQQADTDAYLTYASEARKLNDLVEKLQNESETIKKQAEFTKWRREQSLQHLNSLRQRANDPQETKAESRNRQLRSLAVLAMVIIAVPTVAAWLSLLILFGVPIYDLLNGEGQNDRVHFFGLGLIALLIALGGTALCYFLNVKSKPGKSLRDQVMTLEADIEMDDRAIANFEHWEATPWEKEVFAEFQANDFLELLQLKRERGGFIEQFRLANNLPLDDQ